MNLEAILNQADFRLPANNTSGRPFVVYAERLLEQYVSLIKSSSTDLFINLTSPILAFHEYCQTVEAFSKSLIEVIRLTNKNKPDEAYSKFKELMGLNGPFISNHQGAIHFATPHDTFYRCKFITQPDLKPKEYFFHAPFQLNNKVSSTRFSAPGIPAMYLTNTMIVGYLETRATSLNNFQGVKFSSKMPLSFLNLDYNSPDSSLKLIDKPKFDLTLQIKGLIYPLLLCCYSQKNDDGPAPQEYIIPQILVRWVQENSTLFSGIKYPSTRIDNPNYQGNFYNLIVYPKEIKDEGYCEKLKQSFLISDVCSATLHQTEIEDYYKNEFPHFNIVNPDISTIDWGTTLSDYNTNEIGKMEFYIKHRLTVDKITF